jgi:putative oxidoreductase
MAGTDRSQRSKERSMPELLATTGPWALLPLRLIAGLLFIMHGRPKLFGPERQQMVGLFQQIGIPLPTVGVLLSGLAEFGGGILLILGLLVPVAGLLLLINMLVATVVSVTKLRKPLLAIEQPGYEYDLVLVGVALAFMLFGAGRLSLDELLGLWR